MTRPSRSLVAALVAVALTAAACGDDGPDFTDDAERAAVLAAESGASQSTTLQAPAASEAAASDDVSAPPVTEPPAPTVPPVVPTGVVVPVIALDNSFRQEVIEISVGDEVVWENRGINEHNALPVGAGDWGVETDQFQPGDVYAHVFTVPGEYDYYCSIHGNETVGMVGTVIVKG